MSNAYVSLNDITSGNQLFDFYNSTYNDVKQECISLNIKQLEIYENYEFNLGNFKIEKFETTRGSVQSFENSEYVFIEVQTVNTIENTDFKAYYGPKIIVDYKETQRHEIYKGWKQMLMTAGDDVINLGMKKLSEMKIQVSDIIIGNIVWMGESIYGGVLHKAVTSKNFYFPQMIKQYRYEVGRHAKISDTHQFIDTDDYVVNPSFVQKNIIKFSIAKGFMLDFPAENQEALSIYIDEQTVYPGWDVIVQDSIGEVDPFQDGSGVALYQMDGNANDTGGNYNGTAHNITYSDGKFGQAGVFNGSSSYIDLGNQMAGAYYSFSFWADFQNPRSWGRILDFGETNGSSYQIIVGVDGRATTTTMFYRNGNNSIGSSDHFIIPNEMHHYLTTQDGGNVKFYRDGTLISTTSTSVTPQTHSRSHCYIGHSNWNDPYYTGKIDQVRIFNRALTDDEVTALYRKKNTTITRHFDLISFEDSNLEISFTYQGYNLLYSPDINLIVNGTTTQDLILPLSKTKYFNHFDPIYSHMLTAIQLTTSLHDYRIVDLQPYYSLPWSPVVNIYTENDYNDFPSYIHPLAEWNDHKNLEDIKKYIGRFRISGVTESDLTGLSKAIGSFSVVITNIGRIDLESYISGWSTLLYATKHNTKKEGLYRDVFADDYGWSPSPKIPWFMPDSQIIKIGNTLFYDMSFDFKGPEKFTLSDFKSNVILMDWIGKYPGNNEWMIPKYDLAPYIRIDKSDYSDFAIIALSRTGGSIIHMHKADFMNTYKPSDAYVVNKDDIKTITDNNGYIYDSYLAEDACKVVSSTRYQKSAKVLQDTLDGLTYDQYVIDDAVRYISQKQNETLFFTDFPYSATVVNNIIENKTKGRFDKDFFAKSTVTEYNSEVKFVLENIEDVPDGGTICSIVEDDKIKKAVGSDYILQTIFKNYDFSETKYLKIFGRWAINGWASVYHLSALHANGVFTKNVFENIYEVKNKDFFEDTSGIQDNSVVFPNPYVFSNSKAGEVDPFQDGSGVALYQMEGNANDTGGNYNGVATDVTYEDGKLGQCAYCDGSDNIKIDFNYLLHTDKDYSISLWYKSTQSSNVILNNGRTGNAYNTISLYSNNFIIDRYNNIDSGASDRLISLTYDDISTGDWKFLTCTKNNLDIKIYIDNSLVANGTMPDNCGGSNYSIGLFDIDGNHNQKDAFIDQVRIFNRALTDDEVTVIHQECIVTAINTINLNGYTSGYRFRLVFSKNFEKIVSQPSNFKLSPPILYAPIYYNGHMRVGEVDLAGLKSPMFNGTVSFPIAELRKVYADFWIKLSVSTRTEKYKSVYSDKGIVTVDKGFISLSDVDNKVQAFWMKMFFNTKSTGGSISASFMDFNISENVFDKTFSLPYFYVDDPSLEGVRGAGKSSNGSIAEDKLKEINDSGNDNSPAIPPLDIICGPTRSATYLEYQGFDHIFTDGDNRAYGTYTRKNREIMMAGYIRAVINSAVPPGRSLAELDIMKRSMAQIVLSKIGTLNIIKNWNINKFALDYKDFGLSASNAEQLNSIDEVFRNLLKAVISTLGDDTEKQYSAENKPEFPAFPDRPTFNPSFEKSFKVQQYFLVRTVHV